MKVCKVRPKRSICDACLKAQMIYNKVEDCSKCFSQDTTEYEILGYGSNFWLGDFVMVLINGKIEKMPIDRVYDVHEVEEKVV